MEDQAAARPRRPSDCILMAHGDGGMHSGRHKQLADAFATQGWLAILPDFSANSGEREVWPESVHAYFVDYLLPWLEEQGVAAIHCVGFGSGVIPCAYAASAEEDHLRGGSRVPRFVGTVLVQPELKKPMILSDGEMQKLVA